MRVSLSHARRTEPGESTPPPPRPASPQKEGQTIRSQRAKPEDRSGRIPGVPVVTKECRGFLFVARCLEPSCESLDGHQADCMVVSSLVTFRLATCTESKRAV